METKKSTKKKKWQKPNHWKKLKTSKTKKTTTPLLGEGEGLIGPATDLLPNPEHLIDKDTSSE